MSTSTIRNIFQQELNKLQVLKGSPMAAPASIKNLAGTLRDHLKRATDRANKIGDNFGKSVDNLHSRLDETEAMQKEVDDAAREIQEVIGTPNGGPPLEK